ncbi:MAG: hypothetical protein WC867_05040 [Candidatus Pacearchaeota archaeon]|jgi:hypothetical protein
MKKKGVEILIIISLLFLTISFVSASWTDGFKKMFVTGKVTTGYGSDPELCSDPDGGAFVTTKSTCQDSLGSHEETCNGNTLVEYNCMNAVYPNTGKVCKEYLYDCKEGCLDGKCIFNTPWYCQDSDNGEDINVKGTLKLQPFGDRAYARTEYCFSKTQVVELICGDYGINPGGKYFYDKVITCPSGKVCCDGACVESATDSCLPGSIFREMSVADNSHCSDSDGGKYYFKKGENIVDLWGVNGNKHSIQDRCLGNVLHEYYCLEDLTYYGEYWGRDIFTCPGSCLDGACVNGDCTPNCAGKNCGSDGCSGTCGSCQTGYECSTVGTCVPANCTPNCAGKNCGPDGCSGSCGTCQNGSTCSLNGTCVKSCTPNCANNACGSDGCSGSCGTCISGYSCSEGACITDCTPNCAGKTCGSDGCSGSCGTCPSDKSCIDNKCKKGYVACIDSDDGLDFNKKGTAKDSQDIPFTDSCKNKGSFVESCSEESCLLVEYYCDKNDNKVLSKPNKCEFGCLDGACKTNSLDNDNTILPSPTQNQENILESNIIEINPKDKTLIKDTNGVNVFLNKDLVKRGDSFSKSNNEIILKSKKDIEIKITPSNAIELAKVDPVIETLSDIEISEYKGVIVYDIIKESDKKLLGLIPIKYKENVKLTVDDGMIIAIKLPWWNILAS